MLVVALEVEVGDGAGDVAAPGMRAGRRVEHVEEGRARIEPDVEDVGALGVVVGIGAEPVARVEPRPGLDAAFGDERGGAVQQLERVGVQLARVPVQEERQRHAPVALAADAPVGPVGDHVAQMRAAVVRKEAGGSMAASAVSRSVPAPVDGEHAGRVPTAVHADEPLRGGAVDHRRLVAPAVRIAVLQRRAGVEPPGAAQRLDDRRHGLPDRLAAEQRPVGRIAAVGLHRVEDLVDGHAVGAAAVEVVDAVGRRRMHDAGAVLGGRVVGRQHRADAVVAGMQGGQRMVELESGQPVALDGGEHAAGERVALQAALDQRLGEDQQAAVGVDQRVVEAGVDVERLVGRQRPRGGGPDDGVDRLVGRQLRAGRARLGVRPGARQRIAHALERRVVELAQSRDGGPVAAGCVGAGDGAAAVRQRGHRGDGAVEAEGGEQGVRHRGQEAHVDRVRAAVGVLDLELGQRRAAVEAPVHRLEAAVDKAALQTRLSARISPASLAKSIVRYGRSQSPSTPRRLKSARCWSICSAA